MTVRLTASAVEIFDGAQLVAHHERAAGRHAEVLVLDHYLEVIKTKPGALSGATALAQATAAGAFTATHQRYWDAARQARGDAAGTRALIEALLPRRPGAGDATLATSCCGVSAGVPGVARPAPSEGTLFTVR